jgi:putative ABC transport system permease protein
MTIMEIARLARIVSLPHWHAHRGRTVLTLIGVALGVATVIGISDVSKSVLVSFGDMVDTVAGDADLEVSAKVGLVPEDRIALVQSVPGVDQSAGVVERFLPLAGAGSESIYVLGVDFLGTSLWQRQFPRDEIEIEDEVLFLSNVDSVAAPRELLRRLGIDLDGSFDLVSPEGTSRVTVRGLIGDVPAVRLFDRAMVLMDLPAAQRLLRIKRSVDRISVRVSPGAGVDDVRQAIAAVLGPGYDVAPPAARTDRVARLMFSLRTTLAIMSLGAVIVGAFIVYHTVALSILQRRREFALLNACGIGRLALVWLCVVETLALSVPGVLMGAGMGKLLARFASGLVGATVSEIWVPVDVTTIAWSVWGTVVGVVVGLGTALVAAVVAIRQTFEAPTIEALRPAGLASDEPGSVRRPLLLGLALVGGVWLIALAPRELGFVETVTAIIGTQVLGYAGLALIAAPMVWATGTAARRTFGKARALPLRLSADNLPRSPGRSAGIVATIGATMGIAVTVAILVQSHEVMSIGWIEQHFGADLFVGSGDRVRLMPGAPMEPDVAARVAHADGVQSVERFRVIPIEVEGRPAFLQGIDLVARGSHGGLPMVRGSLEGAAPSLRDGTGVLLSENLAYRLDRDVGDVVEVPTPQGERAFKVAGIYVDYLGSLDHGAVVVDDELLRSVWKDGRANLLRVWLSPGASLERARSAVLDALGSAHGYFVLTARSFVDGIHAVIDRFFAATWALEVVAALVGVIGVINTQLANVLDRASEIRVMRTIGITRRDVVRSVIAECGALGAIGGVLGVGLGVVFGSQIVLVSLRLVTGWRMPFVVPVWSLVVAILVAAIVSALAGIYPARKAADLSVGQRSLD